MHSDSPMFQEQSTRYDTQLIFYIPPRKNPDMRRKWCHIKINTTASFYSWIYNRYSWISIQRTHLTNQYLSIVLFTYSVGWIVDGNET